jgi:hypothetical protein
VISVHALLRVNRNQKQGRQGSHNDVVTLHMVHTDAVAFLEEEGGGGEVTHHWLASRETPRTVFEEPVVTQKAPEIEAFGY